MKRQALRPVALMLSLLLVAAVPAQAGTIHLADVIQLAAETRRGTATDLRLRSIQQQGGPAVASGVTQTTTQGKSGSTGQNTPSGDTVPSATTVGNTTASIVQDPGQQQGGQVETIDLGDVTGTVCDCGVFPIEEFPGGFPKWPFLALAGIPLFFINGGDKPPTGPTPGTTPPPDVIPEPATLMLFGTSLLALGAGARRRRRHNKSLNVDTDGAGEV